MTTFHQSLGFAQHQVGNLDMAVGRFIKGRSNYLSIDAAGHVGHLLRTLVDEQDDHIGLGMVFRDGVGNFLQQHGFTGLGLCDDKSALAFTDGREHIYHAL